MSIRSISSPVCQVYGVAMSIHCEQNLGVIKYVRLAHTACSRRCAIILTATDTANISVAISPTAIVLLVAVGDVAKVHRFTRHKSTAKTASGAQPWLPHVDLTMVPVDEPTHLVWMEGYAHVDLGTLLSPTHAA